MDLVDKTGKRLEGLLVFSESIRYIKQAAIATINKSQPVKIEESSIQWVLTVPAIWGESAKQFMRQAANVVIIFCYNMQNECCNTKW